MRQSIQSLFVLCTIGYLLPDAFPSWAINSFRSPEQTHKTTNAYYHTMVYIMQNRVKRILKPASPLFGDTSYASSPSIPYALVLIGINEQDTESIWIEHTSRV
ncbi:hypothetical protein EV127DRAFT_420745, partial [Xylaria flabelliformis]